MNTEIPQFGSREEGVECIVRPGVYALCMNVQRELAVVEVNNKYFLIGGGLDPGETEEACLRREVMEEVGKKIKGAVLVGHANEYFVDSSGKYWNKIGTFYKVEFFDAQAEVVSEPTHVFKWVTKEEFRRRARHQAQVWAVENLL